MEKIKIGIFGLGRGSTYADLMLKEEDIEIVCFCDKKAVEYNLAKRYPDIPAFLTFDEFLAYGLEHGMNSVFLANYFHQHTPYAIKAMEAGLDVISECTPASTLKECVELVEAVERTGRKYMLAENYPFITMNLAMNKIVRSGKLGKIVYAEGEYNHSGTAAELRRLSPEENHWRSWLPRSYYLTHAMGPLMYMTDSLPKYVSARASHSKYLEQVADFRHNSDCMAIMLCEMSNGMVARFTGCTAFGSDYSRYRMVGDLGSTEVHGSMSEKKVRVFYPEYTRPENTPSEEIFTADLSEYGDLGKKAASAGHGGGDFWVVNEMKNYFLKDIKPFFDVYTGVAMSATAILAWRSCLNHGENFKIPDFKDRVERAAYRYDALTPFPDENGEGATLPSELDY